MCWEKHDILRCFLELYLERNLLVVIKLEEGHRLKWSQRSWILHPSFFPFVVVLLFEVAESKRVLKWLHSIREEYQTFAKRESSSLCVCWHSDRDFLDNHLFSIHMSKSYLRLWVVTCKHLVVVHQELRSYMLVVIASAFITLDYQGQVLCVCWSLLTSLVWFFLIVFRKTFDWKYSKSWLFLSWRHFYHDFIDFYRFILYFNFLFSFFLRSRILFLWS